jgi:[ribosomal protein S18]-alanine N-acetyltransferase
MRRPIPGFQLTVEPRPLQEMQAAGDQEPPALMRIGEAQVTIEEAHPGDIDRVLAIEAGAFDPALYTRMTRRLFRRHLAGGSAVFLVARDASGSAIGYALGFTKRNTNYLRLYSLAVDPAHQGGRVGAELFAAFEDAARHRGLRGVQLEIREDNSRLRERYLRLGYQIYREVPDYYPDGAGCLKLKRDVSS